MLHDQITIEDPVALEKPFTYTLAYRRMPNYKMVEFVCENNREYIDDNGAVQACRLPASEAEERSEVLMLSVRWWLAVLCPRSRRCGAGTHATPLPLGPLAPANLAKPRPKPPFDLTGTWFIDMAGSQNSWRFGPPPAANKMTAETQKHFEAAQKAQKEGKVYRDDIGQCWPAGLPMIMTRVWPIAMVQLPTAIYMVSHFMNSLRIVYHRRTPAFRSRRRRPHASTASRSASGRGDTLVVDTTHFVNDHHWIDCRHPRDRRAAHRRADAAAQQAAPCSRSNTR